MNGRVLIKNAQIIESGNSFKLCDIRISNGIIREIGKISPLEDEEVYEAREQFLFPGVIDPHVHMRTPGFEYKEDFETGSLAALKGGVTRVFDMPNTQPATITLEALEEKIELAKGHSKVGMGFYFGATAPKEILNKCVGVKLFLSETTGSMIENEKGRIKRFFEMPTLVAVHAEEEKMQEAVEYFQNGKASSLYLCHVASENELNIIRKARENTQNIYAEVSPHHLFFTLKDFEKNKMLYMKPMLKSEQDRVALRQALANGEFDTVGSDHAPHSVEEKLTSKSFGIPGVQYLFPLVLELVAQGIITYEHAQKLCSENVARIFNVDRCGKIQVGYRADLTLVSKEAWTIAQEDVVSKCGWTPYEGMELSHRVEATWINGKLEFERKMEDR